MTITDSPHLNREPKLTPRQIELFQRLDKSGVLEEKNLDSLVAFLEGWRAMGWLRRTITKSLGFIILLSAVGGSLIFIRDNWQPILHFLFGRPIV